MNINRSYFVTFCVTFCFSCMNNKNDVYSTCNYEHISIDSTYDNNVLYYSQLYSKIEYIPLETTDESLLAEISKLNIMDDGKILIFDRLKDGVFLFGKDGRYLRQIGNKGNAHNEYSSIKDAAYDCYNNQVVIYDIGTNHLMFYNLKGQFLFSFELYCYPSAISVIDKEHICLFLNYTDDLSRQSVGNNIKIVNRKGEIKSEYLEYDSKFRNFHPACENVFSQSDETLFIKPPYSSIIYKVSTNNLSPSFCYDLGKKSISEDSFVNTEMDFSNTISILKNGTFIYSFLKVRSNLFLQISNCGRVYLCVIDTNNPNNKIIAAHIKNDIFGLVSTLSPVAMKGGKCYHVIDAQEFMICRETIENNKGVLYNVENGKLVEYTPTQSERDLLDSIHDGDNPIIQVCTLK